MGLRIPKFIHTILRRLSTGASDDVTQTENPVLDATKTDRIPGAAVKFEEGEVVRAGAGGYDVTVNIDNRGEIGCVVLANAIDTMYDVTDSHIPPEGSRVFVCIPGAGARYGIVMGVLPKYSAAALTDAERTKAGPGFADITELESSATAASEEIHVQPVRDEQNMTTIDSGAGRALDLLPGMRGVLSPRNCGYVVDMYSAMLTAGPRANLKVSAIDDTAMLTAGYFKSILASGTREVFNDGGQISDESGLTPYQCERSGFTALGIPIFEDVLGGTLKDGSVRTSLANTRASIVSKKRLQSFAGFFGDIINLFVASPDKTLDPESLSDLNNDQGLAQIHVGTDGRIIMRSASGMLFQRCDRIPVPKRIRKPWDPEGDKPEDDNDEPEARLPFKYDASHPHGRSLQWRDSIAWHIKNTYARFSNAKKDFYLPEEADMSAPDNDYDVPGNASADFASNNKKNACFGLEDDGSFIVRDAWGSEMIMRGGNIIFNCAGNFEVKSGKTTVILGGHDVIIKGHESVDITAAKKDVRLASKKNLMLHAHGITLESAAESAGASWDSKGEAVQSAGIVLKAAKSGVLVKGKYATISADSRLKLDTVDDDGENNGRIEMRAHDILTNTDQNTILTAGDGSMLYIGEGTVKLVGESAALVGSDSASVVKGADIMQAQWFDTGSDQYDAQLSLIKTITGDIKSDDWLDPWLVAVRKAITFSYRTSAEYGTIGPVEVSGGGKFNIYQPFWSVMADNDEINAPTDTWDEDEINDTRSWPGKTAWSSAYAKLDNETNIEEGLSKSRAKVTGAGGSISDGEFSELPIAQH